MSLLLQESALASLLRRNVANKALHLNYQKGEKTMVPTIVVVAAVAVVGIGVGVVIKKKRGK